MPWGNTSLEDLVLGTGGRTPAARRRNQGLVRDALSKYLADAQQKQNLSDRMFAENRDPNVFSSATQEYYRQYPTAFAQLVDDTLHQQRVRQGRMDSSNLPTSWSARKRGKYLREQSYAHPVPVETTRNLLNNINYDMMSHGPSMADLLKSIGQTTAEDFAVGNTRLAKRLAGYIGEQIDNAARIAGHPGTHVSDTMADAVNRAGAEVFTGHGYFAPVTAFKGAVNTGSTDLRGTLTDIVNGPLNFAGVGLEENLARGLLTGGVKATNVAAKAGRAGRIGGKMVGAGGRELLSQASRRGLMLSGDGLGMGIPFGFDVDGKALLQAMQDAKEAFYAEDIPTQAEKDVAALDAELSASGHLPPDEVSMTAEDAIKHADAPDVYGSGKRKKTLGLWPATISKVQDVILPFFGSRVKNAGNLGHTIGEDHVGSIIHIGRKLEVDDFARDQTVVARSGKARSSKSDKPVILTGKVDDDLEKAINEYNTLLSGLGHDTTHSLSHIVIPDVIPEADRLAWATKTHARFQSDFPDAGRVVSTESKSSLRGGYAYEGRRASVTHQTINHDHTIVSPSDLREFIKETTVLMRDGKLSEKELLERHKMIQDLTDITVDPRGTVPVFRNPNIRLSSYDRERVISDPAYREELGLTEEEFGDIINIMMDPKSGYVASVKDAWKWARSNGRSSSITAWKRYLKDNEKNITNRRIQREKTAGMSS